MKEFGSEKGGGGGTEGIRKEREGKRGEGVRRCRGAEDLFLFTTFCLCDLNWFVVLNDRRSATEGRRKVADSRKSEQFSEARAFQLQVV